MDGCGGECDWEQADLEKETWTAQSSGALDRVVWIGG
jgi:hypothetical protein